MILATALVLLGPWTDAQRADAQAGLDALPPALRDFPGGPLELQLHGDSTAPFGMGGWTDGRRRFHLHGFAPVDDRRATWRTDRLTPERRESLWRKRAVVHAVMQRWDDARHFSAHPDWRALNGWLDPFSRPFTWSHEALNRADAGFSRALGQKSAALDFVTFAEEHFVPVEGIAADDEIRCQEFSKRRVLEALTGAKTDRGACPAFDAWADLPRLQHLEALLVQASGRAAQSLFGHVLLRPVHREGATVRGPSFDAAIQLAALTNPELGVRHLARGVFGGYRMTVFTVSWRDFEREMLEDEQRSIRRFKLELTPAQARQVLERAWELERRGAYQYQFFSDNCAAGLQWLLQGALGSAVSIPHAGRFIVAPGQVMDGLAEATLDGHRLLTRLPDDFESTTQRAERSEGLRLALEARIRDQAPGWERVFAGARSHDPAVRVRAYEAADALTRAKPLPILYDWWALTVRIERPNADRADDGLRVLRRHTALPFADGTPFDPDAELAYRQQSFEQESWLKRQVMMLDRAEAIAARLDAQQHRPLSPGEQRDFDEAHATLAAFDRVTALHGALVADVFAHVSPEAWLEQDRRQKQGAQAVLEEKAVPQSGHWRTRVGAGVWLDRGGRAAPVVAIASAGLAELVGDQRIRGFHASSEIRILDTEVVLAPKWKAEWPEVVESRFTLFAFRSIRRELQMATDSPLRPFGWGVSLDTDYRAGRTVPSRTSVGGELIAIAGHSKSYDAFLTGALGASAFLGWGGDALTGGLAPYALISGRVPLPGHGANALRVEVRAELGLTPTVLLPELTATAGVDVKLGSVLLRPSLGLHTEPGPKPAQAVALLSAEIL